MKTKLVRLTKREFADLDGKYSNSGHNSSIGNRAIEIVKIYFRKRYPECRISKSNDGSDLTVRVKVGRPAIKIEVKGTPSNDLSLGTLRVSSAESYKKIAEELIDVYRVTGVFDRRPTIHILTFGVHFDLQPEPRWRFKSIRGTEESVSLSKGKKKSAKEKRPTQRRASKYDKLTEYLESSSADEALLTFGNAKRLLGFDLPKSALQYPAYWANQTDVSQRPWARAWQAAGFYVQHTHLSGPNGWVVFRRRKPTR